MKSILVMLLIVAGGTSAQALEQSLGPGYKCELSDSLDNADIKYDLYLYDMIFAPVGANPPGAGRVYLDHHAMFPNIPVVEGQATLQHGFAGLSVNVIDSELGGTIMTNDRFYGFLGESHLSGLCTWSVNLKREVQP